MDAISLREHANGRHPPTTLRPALAWEMVNGMLVDCVSIRRACGALRFDMSSYHYKSRRPGQAALELRSREICAARVRYGYRRIHVSLRREGW